MFKHNRFLNRLSHRLSLWLLLSLVPACTVSAAETIHHDLHVKLRPSENIISVIDSIQLPAGTDSTEFSLRNGLTIKATGIELTLLGESDTGRLRHYQINRVPADGKVQLSYEGKIVSEKTVGPFDMPESALDTENVYLDAGSAWLPVFKSFPLHTSSLEVEAPMNWQFISQGKRSDVPGGYTFDMPHPQDDLYLIAGPYQRYSIDHDGIEIVVYLYQEDASLAENYLQASAHYISLYNDWIGRYPYAKFAVVENRWQTGYGMPSFTLLGSRVIRLPFILNTSLPHEILHNWWGNGVYVDISRGNWSEGLTAYMSDHFNSKQQGKDREYRRKALERYANFAAEDDDFALSDFRSRHDDASQAVGYSKASMLFHMLRMQSGDDVFDDNIKRFWQRYQFAYANFIDLIQQLHSDTDNHNDEEYRRFVEQWLIRTGAPVLSLDDVSVKKQEDGYSLSIKVRQLQQGPAYRLQVPIEVTVRGDTRRHRENIQLTEKSNLITFKFDKQPQAVTLDPDYDVFRLLHADERPASLGRLFGANKQLLVMPADATAGQIKAWRELAATWSRRYKNVELVFDNEIKTIPDDVSLWLLGWNNALLKDRQQYFTSQYQLSTTQTFSQSLSGNTVTIGEQQMHADRHAVVLLDADNRRTPLGFIGAQAPEVIAAMASKLPHYSSYGRLVFELPEVNNIIKQNLPVLNSPMSWKSEL
ncbi:MAG: M1 family aminopeptidase [Gammaproteobacteria bacterium]|nr:M1 family aminopeptidase [Gammaproteobacteria bacterium]